MLSLHVDLVSFLMKVLWKCCERHFQLLCLTSDYPTFLREIKQKERKQLTFKKRFCFSRSSTSLVGVPNLSKLSFVSSSFSLRSSDFCCQLSYLSRFFRFSSSLQILINDLINKRVLFAEWLVHVCLPRDQGSTPAVISWPNQKLYSGLLSSTDV